MLFGSQFHGDEDNARNFLIVFLAHPFPTGAAQAWRGEWSTGVLHRWRRFRAILEFTHFWFLFQKQMAKESSRLKRNSNSNLSCNLGMLPQIFWWSCLWSISLVKRHDLLYLKIRYRIGFLKTLTWWNHAFNALLAKTFNPSGRCSGRS